VSYIGKTVTFRLVDGTLIGGVVTGVVSKDPFDDHVPDWYKLDTGWTVNEKHVTAAHWEEAKSV
jgi:hypothetical protein